MPYKRFSPAAYTFLFTDLDSFSGNMIGLRANQAARPNSAVQISIEAAAGFVDQPPTAVSARLFR
jgi:hypothetical protein